MKRILVFFAIAALVGPRAALAADTAQPPSPPPGEPPPPPAIVTPAPHGQPLEAVPNPGAAAAPAAPAGQWVYTSEYGWLWMPYDSQYVDVRPDATLAYEFVFYPSFGWRWVVAPWVLGLGAVPYWGPHGVVGFAWHAHPRLRVAVPFRGPGWGHASPRAFHAGRRGRR